MTEPRDRGNQPFGALLEGWGLVNHDLVDASTLQLTHKQVQRARKGRMLTLPMMRKVTQALNDAVSSRLTKAEREAYVAYLHRHLFNYAKGFDASFRDPNSTLMEAVRERRGENADRPD